MLVSLRNLFVLCMICYLSPLLHIRLCVYILFQCFVSSVLCWYEFLVRLVNLSFLDCPLVWQVSTLFESWYQICEVSGANETACSQYVLHLHETGLLKGDNTTESFFRILLVSLTFYVFLSIHSFKILWGLIFDLGVFCLGTFCCSLYIFWRN